MRTTQYIGLNERGQKFVEHWPEDHLSTNHTLGMFEEKVPLGSWEGGRFLEKTQIEPWSSGPMIFTAIWDIIDKGWVEETLWHEGMPEDSEYDYSTGKYYV